MEYNLKWAYYGLIIKIISVDKYTSKAKKIHEENLQNGLIFLLHAGKPTNPMAFKLTDNNRAMMYPTECKYFYRYQQ